MLRKKQGELEWLEFELLSEIPSLVHGVFLRQGGVSLPPYASLNAGENVGDESASVLENRERIRRQLEITSLISGKQVHGTEILYASHSSTEMQCDGLMTKEKRCGLMITHADCQAAIFYDPHCKALAIIHCGWRGNVSNIYAKTVSFMKERWGSMPQDLLVCISPSLGPKRAEFKHFKEEFPKSFWEFQISPTYFDFWAISRHQLEECGVLPHHIEEASMCTYENPQDFFSYRREKITGRHATAAALR